MMNTMISNTAQQQFTTAVTLHFLKNAIITKTNMRVRLNTVQAVTFTGLY